MSVAIAPRLLMNMVGTYGMGSFDRTSMSALERDRANRYEKLFVVVETFLRERLSVWVDGNFTYRALRRQLWKLAETYGVEEVVVMQCICSDEKMLEERFSYRRADPRQPDAGANDLSAYHGSVRQFESLHESEFGHIPTREIIIYDSCGRAIQPQMPHTALGALIKDCLVVTGLVHHGVGP